jgi:hypothetical protein
MAEKIISPGVFTKEIDASFLPAAIGEIGAAIVGPTVKGPAGIPTVVESYAEFQAKFGDSFKSGNNYYQYLTSLTAENYLKHSGKLTVVRILDGSFSGASAQVHTGTGNYFTGSAANNTADSDSTRSFKIHTLADGGIMNNRPKHADSCGSDVGTAAGGYSVWTGSNATLISGSKDNLRWEVAGVNLTKGTFNLLIRAGNDTLKRKQVIESWNNLSLDTNQNNYIGKVIGDSQAQMGGTYSDPYITYVGEYPNKSKYIRVSSVSQTVDYLDENGNQRDTNHTAS